ncbi:MAG: hypothetical protein R8K21_06900 [Mariprofundales bacterium]
MKNLPLCHACRLCDLACPAWRYSRDTECGPRAIVIYDQRQQDISESQTQHCSLCAACDAACPIGLQPMKIIMQYMQVEIDPELLSSFSEASLIDAIPKHVQSINDDTHLLLGRLDDAIMRDNFADITLAKDTGDDILQAWMLGKTIPEARLKAFLAPLVSSNKILVINGLLYYAVRNWLPDANLQTLAEALLPEKKQYLQAGDMFILDAPAFNSDQIRLLPIMQAIAKQHDIFLNLDLQRLAMPLRGDRDSSNSARALQARWAWLVKQKTIKRVVTECRSEAAIATAISGLPAIWLADLGITL